ETEDDEDRFDDDILDPLSERQEQRRSSPGHAPRKESIGKPGRQYRQPFEYGQLLKTLGLDIKQEEVTIRYYRERALPYLLPFPSKPAPQSSEPLIEGYSQWEVGDPLGDFDPIGSLYQSPLLIPGVTTVQRVYAESPGSEPARQPLDLDIYVDSSG